MVGGRRRSRWGEGDGSQVHRQRRGGERCCFPEVLPPGARLAGADTSLLALRWLRGGIFLKPFTYIQVKTAANKTQGPSRKEGAPISWPGVKLRLSFCPLLLSCQGEFFLLPLETVLPPREGCGEAKIPGPTQYLELFLLSPVSGG